MLSYYVYIMTNMAFGTLYIGVTNNLIRRVFEHKGKFVEGFTKENDLDKLVYYEVHNSIESAIVREKQLKKWNRNWKLRLIMDMNPRWEDLYENIAA